MVFKRNDPNTPVTITGAVRLADKYLIEPLHRCLVQQVCQDWPATLEEYDIKQGEIDSLREVAMDNPGFKYTPDDDRGRMADAIPEPASAILFAREFRCEEILPAAFYRLSLIPAIFDYSVPLVHTPLARWSILDGDSLFKCMKGCQIFRQYRPHPSRFLSEGCADAWMIDDRETPCYRSVARLIGVVFKEGPSATHSDPLHLLAKCSRYWEMWELSKERCPDRLCDYCEEVLSVKLGEERKRIWRELPKYFDLV